MQDRTDISDLAVHHMIGNRYQLTQLLRQGGMGQIYLAEDTQLFHRQVVVKLLSLQAPEIDHQLRCWFANEAQISVFLGDHPQIIKVLDYGVEQTRPYLVMEYLGQRPKGYDLEEYLHLKGRLSPAEVVHLGSQICSGLAYAHQFTTTYEDQLIQGVIHRDLKPSNLFIVRHDILGDSVKILDFGIAKILSGIQQQTDTQLGFVGTLSHASPEQIRGERVTPSSDIYSLGIVLYKMLTGDHPLYPPSSSFKDWFIAHTQRDPIPFNARLARSIPKSLEDIVMSCLEKTPQNRPESMQILSEALENSLDQASQGHQELTTQPYRQNGSPDTIDLRGTRTAPESYYPPTRPLQVIESGIPRIEKRQDSLTPVLLRYVGPIAPLLLQETLKQNPTDQDLVLALAEVVPDQDRKEFIQQTQKRLAALSEMDSIAHYVVTGKRGHTDSLVPAGVPNLVS